MEELSEIRKQMSAALKRKDIAEYHRIGAEHRCLLHEASPDLKAAWKACQAGKAAS